MVLCPTGGLITGIAGIHRNAAVVLLHQPDVDVYKRQVLPVQTKGKHPLHLVIKTSHVRKAATVDGELLPLWLLLSLIHIYDQAMIATLGGLRKELEKLNQLAWQADEDTILGWADTEGYPVDGTLGPDGQYLSLIHIYLADVLRQSTVWYFWWD